MSRRRGVLITRTYSGAGKKNITFVVDHTPILDIFDLYSPARSIFVPSSIDDAMFELDELHAFPPDSTTLEVLEELGSLDIKPGPFWVSLPRISIRMCGYIAGHSCYRICSSDLKFRVMPNKTHQGIGFPAMSLQRRHSSRIR